MNVVHEECPLSTAGHNFHIIGPQATCYRFLLYTVKKKSTVHEGVWMSLCSVLWLQNVPLSLQYFYEGSMFIIHQRETESEGHKETCPKAKACTSNPHLMQ